MKKKNNKTYEYISRHSIFFLYDFFSLFERQWKTQWSILHARITRKFEQSNRFPQSLLGKIIEYFVN